MKYRVFLALTTLLDDLGRRAGDDLTNQLTAVLLLERNDCVSQVPHLLSLA